MKRTIAWIAAINCLLISFFASGQTKTADSHSLLWSITGKELKKTSYLFGTIHMICANDFLWTPAMKQSLEQSDKICFEMNLSDPAVMLQVAAGLADTSGKKLQDYFTPEQYTIVKNYIKDSLSMDIALFENLKPVALETMIGTAGINCANPVSYEDSLMKTAVSAGKEIIGLETPDEQLKALESIPVDTVIKQLMDEMLNNDGSDSELNKLISAYKKQDLPELYKLITESKEVGTDMAIFLDDRNKKWIPRMAENMNNTSVFFAVGAGHLWGDLGIITLLRKAGYTVKPMK